MKYLEIFGLIVFSAMTLVAVLGAGSASATTIEITKVTMNTAVTNTISLKPGTKTVVRDTAGFSKNECSESHTHGTTSSFTGAAAMADQTVLSFGNCTRAVTTHSSGKFEFVWTSGTNGTVASQEAQITVGSAIGTLTCNTGATTNIGTVTGVASGNAPMDVNAVLNCGIIPSAKWEGEYIITVPHAFGITA